MQSHIAFIAYETPYAPCGGVAGVMARLPRQLAKAAGLPTFVITPFHYKISKSTDIKRRLQLLGDLVIPYEGNQIKVKVMQLDRDVSWVFLQAEDRRFFAGARHPYDVGGKQDEMSRTLLRDALFFGLATARALPLIAPSASWILLMQDWEAATLALVLSTGDVSFDWRAYLTIHNSYDSSASDVDLLKAEINPSLCPGDSILQRALSLVQEPVFTVSEMFARDLSEELLQRKVIAPHLQSLITSKLVGVNNGPFIDLAVPQPAIGAARCGDYSGLVTWKSHNRKQALAALDKLEVTRERPIWGNLARFKRDETPWYVMAGRDDPRQKGYDVACAAISRFLSRGGQARFLLFPIPGDEGLPGLGFLKKLAQGHPESVLILPFIFREGYIATMQAAAFGVMPSLYEPFGMAHEFYLMGAVGIGRATGGILQQIVPLRAASTFSQSVQTRSAALYGTSARPTGILYREPDNLPTAVTDWQGINAAGYNNKGKPNRVEQRSTFALFQEMAAELSLAIEDATRLFTHQPDLYFQMLVEGIDYVQNSFSWENAGQAYRRYINRAFDR